MGPDSGADGGAGEHLAGKQIEVVGARTLLQGDSSLKVFMTIPVTGNFEFFFLWLGKTQINYFMSLVLMLAAVYDGRLRMSCTAGQRISLNATFSDFVNGAYRVVAHAT